MEAVEQAIVRRARLRIGLLVGLTIGGLLLLAGGISYAVLVRGQEAQIQRELAWGTEHGTIAGPPACSWIFRYDGTTCTPARTRRHRASRCAMRWTRGRHRGHRDHHCRA